ncbi:MAG TPA: [protein-PII] uridylyltransferase [Steroidobacteraceae bacterium]|nr:[protein-PII] uridylyltransferase [Steroidobacteraceae bacterium]
MIPQSHDDRDDAPELRSAPAPAWRYLSSLNDTLAACGDSITDPPAAIAVFREALRKGGAELTERFSQDEPVETLVRDRARLVDALLEKAWRLNATQAADLALLAVGGYGRGELHPCSDIDVCILLPKSDSQSWQPGLERFLTFLWDIGLEVGHSVRTIDDCQRESLADISVATTLIESRLLAGPAGLYGAMKQAIAPERVWSAQDFFEAKVAEQVARHHRFHDTAYNLEPNVKSSPGGLRDIQTIGWVAKRHFGTDTLDGLVPHGFLTRNELRKLQAAQAFLWRVRFALHMLTGRREDRLLFDHQIKLAKLFGYEDATYTLAVEQFMQRYYRTVMDVSLLNEMLLQLFREAILMPAATEGSQPVPLNPRFQIRNDYLEAVNEDVFARSPSALLELFGLMQQNPQIRGVRASTIRHIGRNLWLIDEEFRQNPRHHRLFLDILRAATGVTHELRRMNLYGVLGRYIPAFGRIVGRMQYDLFHAYTVDAHTLFVVSNLRRLAMAKYDQEFPALSRIAQALPKLEIAYLAALFHDIAKGRGGDHSELGAVDAEAFCLEQGLGRYEARLVAWLVRHHLLLSVTAQKKDISDPEVIQDFARKVGDQTHLDYLYVLTVADVRGTNPKLWNSWKASLFEEFYERVKRALRRGLEVPIDQEELVRATREAARAQLQQQGVPGQAIESLWASFTDVYFLRHTPQEVAWHSALLAAREDDDEGPLVAISPQTERGGTPIFTYTAHRYDTFARTTAVLDQMGLNIVDARITPSANGFSLDTYLVLEDNGRTITDVSRVHEIEQSLWRSLRQPAETPLAVTRRAPRQVRMFATPTHVTIAADPRRNRTILELIAGDRPGLLSEVGKIFMAERVDVQGARIMTVGERAEDVFYVADAAGQPLSDETAQRLEQRLLEALDRKA